MSIIKEMKNIKDKLESIDNDHFSLLVNIGKVAHQEKLKAYLVGGMVRDLLLNFDNLDIDIVVENNAKQLSEALAKRFSNCELAAKHDRFHTAKLIFHFDSKNIPIDLASTRQEIYEHSAALPKVKVSELKRDLLRRDFTINALAISLMPDEFGEVVDLFDGLIDLKNKKIRVLHDLSFIDDPTRMIRAVRFACKLGFEIEEYTQKLLDKAINSREFDNLIEKIRGDRVKIEIRYLFNLLNIEEAIDQFFRSGIYRMVSIELKSRRDAWLCVSTNELHDRSRQWLIYLSLVMKDLKIEDQEKIMKNLQMTGEETKIIKSAFQAHKRLQEKNIDSVTIYRELKNLLPESVLIVRFLFQANEEISRLIVEYKEKTSIVKLEITGQDLVKMGVKEGKQVGEILQKVLEMKIKNPDMKKEDEVKEARRCINV